MSELVSKEYLVSEINRHSRKFEKCQEGFDSFEDGDQLFEDYEDLNNLAKLIFLHFTQNPQLNEDQEIVLEWLKENNDKGDVLHPFEILTEYASEGLLEAEPVAAYCFIKDDAMLMAQVIQSFTEWWLSENE